MPIGRGGGVETIDEGEGEGGGSGLAAAESSGAPQGGEPGGLTLIELPSLGAGSDGWVLGG